HYEIIVGWLVNRQGEVRCVVRIDVRRRWGDAHNQTSAHGAQAARQVAGEARIVARAVRIDLMPRRCKQALKKEEAAVPTVEHRRRRARSRDAPEGAVADLHQGLTECEVVTEVAVDTFRPACPSSSLGPPGTRRQLSVFSGRVNAGSLERHAQPRNGYHQEYE